MSKAEILEYFSDINVVYNNCGIYDSLLNMLTEFEQEIRAKIIDEFAERLKAEFPMIEYQSGATTNLILNKKIDEITEEMKVVQGCKL